MSAISKSTYFPATVEQEMFNLVRGKSSLAKMAGAEPLQFNGKDIFTFSFDKKISVVGENAAKPAGDATIGVVQMRPIKVVYQSRVSDEFMYAADEVGLRYLREFAAGFATRLAEGFDEMAMHGIDPATGNAASGTIANNYLDYVIANYNTGSNVITYGHDSSAADVNIDEALALIDNPTGIILGKTIRSAIAALNINGAQKYPEFAWGATPATLGGMTLDSNKTVEVNSNKARAYVGDWNAFRWGIAKQLPLEIIEYGDPDGSGVDLKKVNQVLLRSEAYIGWAFINAADFAVVKQGE